MSLHSHRPCTHTHTQYSVCFNAGLSRTDTLAFANACTQTAWFGFTHTHTHIHTARLPAHVRKMKESGQSVASSLSAAANLLSYATASSPPNCKYFFPHFICFVLFFLTSKVLSLFFQMSVSLLSPLTKPPPCVLTLKHCRLAIFVYPGFRVPYPVWKDQWGCELFLWSFYFLKVNISIAVKQGSECTRLASLIAAA